MPTDLCRYPMPSGQYCRQIALKGEYLCRHHARQHRHYDTEAAHEQAMQRLEARLQSLDLPDLIKALYGKLTHLRSAVRFHPEAQLTLNVTLDRLREWLGANSESEPSTPSNPA